MTCRLSPDGRRLVAISRVMHYPIDSPQIDVWDTGRGSLITHRAFSGDTSCLSPDAKSVTVMTDKGLAVQEVTTGRELLLIPVNLCAPVAFSADGKILAATIVNDLPPRVGGPQGSRQRAAIGIWELETGKQLLRLATEPVGPIAFSPNGRLLATAGLEAIHLWEVATGKEVFQLPRHANFRASYNASFVSSLVFSPDSKTLATGFPDGTILIWDLAPLQPKSRGPSSIDI